jgi:osmotically-inducible protein OsmY
LCEEGWKNHWIRPEEETAMRLLALALVSALMLTGCVSPSAVTHGASRLKQSVEPAARKIADGSQRLVHAAGQAADDAALAAKVKSILLTRKGVDAHGIRVRADDGAIQLTGHVRSLAEKRLASQIVRDTLGVRAVENRLKVPSPSS